MPVSAVEAVTSDFANADGNGQEQRSDNSHPGE